ncbi:NPCBM/NEW2 domain-containing protein [Actinophytocola oryzae]|uniref:Alpha-galactosidase n=1 Tax=Actinophytocola oryzae TaxID=502181 RepID=A0A4R7URR9_9PSEU|nr:NPCBM/NEW2 domain-containing protein [Actinophytocola oryzae]TDV35299.1 alpha-galactosidase [Actinophytocola oryzae]
MRRRTVLGAVVVLLLAAVTVVGSGAGTSAPRAVAIENGLARTPAMGFNNWNATNCRAEFDEQMVRQIADIFVARGLRDAGYTYVNLDDCWALPNRDGAGNLVPDPVRFPNGIKAVADYVHGRGLKFGIYTSAGTKTCNSLGFPGAIGHEQQDANTFASWGVDYLKYDNCGDHLGQSAQDRYTRMRDALLATGRPILFSICEWGSNAPWDWAQPVGNSWRTTGDIEDNWNSMLAIFKANVGLAVNAQRGGWNDPDMLEVGNGGMTDTEYRSHFSLWAMMNAPLLIGSDLRSDGQSTFDILTNRDVIALNQDGLGVQATEIANADGHHVLTKPLDNGDVAVALFNETGSTATFGTTASAAGLGNATSYQLRDLWSKAVTTSTGAVSASVPAHATVVYRVSRAGTFTPPPAGTTQVSALTASLSASAWGPVERDRSNGEQAAGDGRTLTIGGTTYARGIGVHARSEVRYYLGGRCTSFQASVGLDDETGDNGSVAFEVWGNGMLASSGVVRGTDAAKRVTANVSGLQYVHLAVLPTVDGPRYDHADWADATLTCA